MFLVLVMSCVQAQVGFGGSIPRVDVVPESVAETLLPSSMAVTLFALHTQYHGMDMSLDGGLLALVQQAQMNIYTDVVMLLDQAVDKKEVLHRYITTTDTLLTRVTSQLSQTQARLFVLRDLMGECLADKEVADNLFFAAVIINDDLAAQNALADSLAASTCATDYRVQLNALQTQYNKLLFYTSVLQKKYNYVSDRKDTILTYFSVLKPDLLKDLTAIAGQLQSFLLVR
jgi:hypothetical protein